MSKSRSRPLRHSTLWLALLVSGSVWAQAGAPGYERKEAAVHRAEAGRALGQVQGNNHGQVVAAALRANGRDDATLAALREAGIVPGRNGVSHRRFEQSVGGLPVYGSYAKAAFNRNGELVHLIDHLAAVPSAALAAARTSTHEALLTAMRQVHPGVAPQFRSRGSSGLTEAFDGGAFFHNPPTVSAVAVPHSDGSVAAGWLVQTWTQRGNLLDHTLVSGDGRVLNVERRTANDSYNVFLMDPGKGGQVTVNGPAPSSTAPSQLGWLGAGAQTTLTISGNNVSSYLDTVANDLPDGGGTAVINATFGAVANLGANPTLGSNPAVSVQNLFYLNNRLHDILYRHGFTEAAGNFQNNNFGLGGASNDAVNAEAQDGGGTDNANFATPADGQKPRMQMYLFTGPGATHEVIVGAASYGAMGASFGPALSTTGVGGTVVVGSPADGCARMSKAISGKVALINRGTCDFTVKVLNAQSAGATAVIIANNVGTTESFTMGGTSTRVTIPSVMIGLNDGNALRVNLGSATLRKKAVQPLQIDGSLDSDIVYHEYGHGLTWRMIGSMSGAIPGAIGEGMGDGLAMLINGVNDQGAIDSVNGPVMGEYAAASPAGIRRQRYDTTTLTYKNVTGAEVHDDGEIYAAIVWDMIVRFGGVRRDALFDLVVDGMNYTPAAPSFEAMRDGIVSAANVRGGADTCLVWQSFAKFGVGVGSKLTLRRGVATVTESFAKPVGC
jgi:hypothetical protein